MDLSLGVYGSWKEKQIEKYRQMEEVIRNVFEESERVLDVGVSKAWLWRYLEENGYSFREVVGVDVSEEATEPEKEGIEYLYSEEPTSKTSLMGRFDLVVAFDSVHLIDYAQRLPEFLREEGYILQSAPMKFKDSLVYFSDLELVTEGKIGGEEVDHFTLQRRWRK